MKVYHMNTAAKNDLILNMAQLLDTFIDMEREAHFNDSQAHDKGGCNFCETVALLADIGYYKETGITGTK